MFEKFIKIFKQLKIFNKYVKLFEKLLIEFCNNIKM